MHLIAATTSTLFQGQHISCLAGTTAPLFSVLQYALTGGGNHEKRDCVVSFIT